jgi:5-methylcytosine-specific restriction endonuclease McrA
MSVYERAIETGIETDAPDQTAEHSTRRRKARALRAQRGSAILLVVPLKMRQNQPEVLRNTTCCYCGVALADVAANKEHVIAKNFVPYNVLDRSWNLIARACVRCNTRKSDLEDDMAVLSLQHYPFDGTDAFYDAHVRTCLAKAARTRSRRTKRPVAESNEESTLELPLGPGGAVTVGMVAPPQFDDDRAFALAHMQATAFYYLLTYRDDVQRGTCWPGGGFFTVDVAARADWGNPRQRWFMDSVASWEPRLVVVAAQGFFKVAIRKHPLEHVWSCALEWNDGIRATALFGQQQPARATGRSIPPLFTEADIIRRTSEVITNYRSEGALSATDDQMFAFEPRLPDAVAEPPQT